MEERKDVWLRFMAAALTTVKTPEGVLFAAAVADRGLHQFDARFGDAAFLLEGQTACAACHKEIPPGAEFTPSADGVKFCNTACLTTSGRDE